MLEWMIKMNVFLITYSRHFNNLPKYLILKKKSWKFWQLKKIVKFFGEIINYFKKSSQTLMAVMVVKESLTFLITTFSVPNHCIFQANMSATCARSLHIPSCYKCNMKNHYCTNQITHEEGIHFVSLFVILHQVTLKKKKKIYLFQSKLSFLNNFLIIRNKEPYFEDYPFLWKHDIFSPWAFVCEIMFLKIVQQGMTEWHFSMPIKATWQGEPNL